MPQPAAAPRSEEQQTATVGVLGPVEVQAAGRAPAVLAPSVRALLARLALAPGRVVSSDALTDALWGADPPVDAGNALQTRVSKLRRALVSAGVGGDVLVTRAPGYQLAVPAEAVDAHRFERLVSRARTAVGSGDLLTRDLSAVLAGYDEALGLWRGPALADVGDAEWARAERARLDDLRLGAIEDRLELLLELGRHSEAVADLDALVATHPLRERLHRLLMLGLYRGGRQADALSVYHALRRRLADELGIDPIPELQALAAAILRQQVPRRRAGHAGPEPTVGVPQEESPPSSGRQTGPGAATAAAAGHGLPRRLTPVIGRHDDVDRVLGQLAPRRSTPWSTTSPTGVRCWWWTTASTSSTKPPPWWNAWSRRCLTSGCWRPAGRRWRCRARSSSPLARCPHRRVRRMPAGSPRPRRCGCSLSGPGRCGPRSCWTPTPRRW
jgi:DNA-binding SARP family transcriptional activator